MGRGYAESVAVCRYNCGIVPQLEEYRVLAIGGKAADGAGVRRKCGGVGQ
jgi:hypothetical protein